MSTDASVAARSPPANARRAGQHFVQETPERPDVAAFVEGVALDLLGTHVRRCPEHNTDLADRRTLQLIHRGALSVGRRAIADLVLAVNRGRRPLNVPRQTKVQYLHGPVVLDFDIGGLEIAMNDAPIVRRRERLGDLIGDRKRFIERNRSAFETVCECRSVHELEHERVHASRVFETVDGGDARMIERGEHVRLACEQRQALRVVGEHVGEYLQRDVTIQLGIARAIHLPHATRAQDAFDPVRAHVSSRRQPNFAGEQVVGQVPHRRIDQDRRFRIGQQ